MTGAEAIVRSLEASGVDVCFANPGTTEIHLLAAFDRVSHFRMVLGLFEGVATGAADGYARMADRPAATLLHLGPGFANGMANLHNAKRAGSPIVNLVGDHATDHLAFDAPLTSDIEGMAATVSGWVRGISDPRTAGRDAAEAVAAALTPPGQVATLIVPADVAWSESTDGEVEPIPPPARPEVDEPAVRAARAALTSGEPTLLLLGDVALREEGLRHAARIAAATGCDLLAQTSNARVERGRGRPAVERIPYAIDQALARLASYRRIVLAGAPEPVGFFAYPERPGRLVPPGAEVMTLAMPGDDIVSALAWLAEEVRAPDRLPAPEPVAPAEVDGPITRDAIGHVLARMMPENAIVSDESITTGRAFFAATHGAAPHTWLQLTGGAIGDGMPMATGAAIACPDRKVIALQSDGSGMYTLQSLWTQARERLDVTTLIFANRAYAILKGELATAFPRKPGPRARDMVELDRPAIDWVSLARGMGVDGERVEDCAGLAAALGRGLATPGPYLIEVLL